MRLALFDLDHTLLDGDSNTLWLEHLIRHGRAPADAVAAQAAYYADYVAGRLDIEDYLRFQLSPLTVRPVAEWIPFRDAFLREAIAPRIGPAARAAVAAHRHQGDLAAIVTATHDFLAAGIASLLEDLPVIATRAEIVGGRFTGGVVGEACFRERKIACLEDWLAAQDRAMGAFDSVHFYSDSANDLPLLEAASHPVAVDPDPLLVEVARARCWPCVSWRVEGAAMPRPPAFTLASCSAAPLPSR